MPDGVDSGIGAILLVIKEPFGLTVLDGRGLPLAEFLKIADSLYASSDLIPQASTPVPTDDGTPMPTSN